MLGRILTVAEAQARDLTRRRAAMAILVLLPLAFYLSTPSEDEFALVAGGTGMAWAVAGGALFLALASRRIDARLILAGYRPLEVLAGRLLLLEGLALVLVVLFSALMVGMSAPPEPGALVLAVGLSGLVAVPLGLAVASVFPRELEGALTLIAVVGIEMGLPVDSSLAPFLPLWGPLQLVEVARGAAEGLTLPTLHALTSTVALLVISATLWWRRVRITRHAAL
jgi:hypothetical protein